MRAINRSGVITAALLCSVAIGEDADPAADIRAMKMELQELRSEVRYEHIDMDGVDIDEQDAFDLMTFGFNWYHHEHEAKLSLDVVRALDPLPAGLKGLSNGLGLLPDATDEDGQVAMRIQHQLLF